MTEAYIELQWDINYAVDLNLDAEASEIITPILRNDRFRIVSENIYRIEFFKELDDSTFEKLVKSFTLYRVPKGFIFCRSGEPPTSFNMILKGICNMTSMLKEDAIEHPSGKFIGPGQYFPLMETIQGTSCLQTTVSVTACEVIAIDTGIMKDIIFQSNDHWESLISHCVKYRETELDVIISKKKYRKEMEKTPNWVVRLENRKWYELKLTKWQSYKRIWHFIMYPPYIIHPHGRFMIIWESIKFFQVMITLLYVPVMFTLICTPHIWKYLIALFFDIFSMADVVLRFYLGYYNSKGLLVNSGGYYFTHSFFADFISSIPVYMFMRKYKFKVRFYFTVISKVLQIYRLSGYLKALRSRFAIHNLQLLLLTFFTHVVLVVQILSHSVYVGTCSAECDESENFQVSCSAETWISQTSYYEKSEINRNPLSLVVLFANFIVFIVLGNDQGGFYARTVKEMRLILVFVILTTLCRSYYIPRAVSYIVGGYQNFTRHRDNHRLFWAFINNEGGNKAIAQRIYNHFVFDYLKMKGIRMNKLVLSLHPSLQYDLTFAMYYKGMLCLHWFVGPSKTLIKRLCNKVSEMHYKRDSPVIFINDVNDMIYFIREGYINIFNDDDERIRTLGPGSMFGSFKKTGGTRHKYMFVSKYNSNLLQIKAGEFLRVLQVYDQDVYNKFVPRIRNKEYVSFVDDSGGLKIFEDQYNMEVVQPGILNQSSSPYKWAMFFLSMIIPYITMYPLLLTIAVSKYSANIELQAMLYILDMISLIRIFFGFNCTYTDEMTGIHITNLRWIRWNYVKSPSQFFLDVFTVLPFEVFGYLISGYWINALKLNRSGRLLIMIKYILYYRERTYVRIWLRWFEFLSAVSLPPFVFACLWIYLTCQDGCYKIYNMDYEHITEIYDMLMYAMYEVANLVTFSTSYELEKPWNVTECILMVVLGLFSFVMLPILIGKFIQTSIMSNYNQRSYEYNIYCMKIYLQLRDLSTSLLERLWNYSLLLYKTNNGHELPPYIAHAPPGLRCELFFDLYGGHIRYNLLFDECNHDLIFQLAGLLRRTVYFPGDFIIRKLDVDGRMYFINSGEVEELEFDEMNTEIVKEVYITGHCFGLAQGLYERTPHFSYYKARTMVEILTLQRSDWVYLTDLFPDDCRSIFKMARKLSLDSIG